MGALKAIVTATCLIGAAALVLGCDATTGGLEMQHQSPFPYNSKW
jgi:hypothetical protein